MLREWINKSFVSSKGCRVNATIKVPVLKNKQMIWILFFLFVFFSLTCKVGLGKGNWISSFMLPPLWGHQSQSSASISLLEYSAFSSVLYWLPVFFATSSDLSILQHVYIHCPSSSLNLLYLLLYLKTFFIPFLSPNLLHLQTSFISLFTLKKCIWAIVKVKWLSELTCTFLVWF